MYSHYAQGYLFPVQEALAFNQHTLHIGPPPFKYYTYNVLRVQFWDPPLLGTGTIDPFDPFASFHDSHDMLVYLVSAGEALPIRPVPFYLVSIGEALSIAAPPPGHLWHGFPLSGAGDEGRTALYRRHVTQLSDVGPN